MIVTFTIPGNPQQQGSKRPIGRGVGVEANKKLKPWRVVAMKYATEAAQAALLAELGRDIDGTDWPVFTVPVLVSATCYFPRPKAHFRTGRHSHLLRTDAPMWHSSAPDLDKLERAIGDMLTQSGMILDDRLISQWSAAKRYAIEPRIELHIQDLP